MPKAHLVFKQYKNFYSVDVTNLEDLSVEQIQELQEFVSFRNGIFDFNTYSFKIYKTIEFDDFVSLLKHLGIECSCEQKRENYSEVPRINFGQYKGMAVSDLPDSYLTWLKNNYHGEQKKIFLQEIKKRNI